MSTPRTTDPDAGLEEQAAVREAHRQFRTAILEALGMTDPWAITTMNTRRICEQISALRERAERADAVEAERNEAWALNRTQANTIAELLAVIAEEFPGITWGELEQMRDEVRGRAHELLGTLADDPRALSASPAPEVRDADAD